MEHFSFGHIVFVLIIELLQSLSKPFLFYIAAQILPWVCKLQQFLQQLFCSKDYADAISPHDHQYTPDYSEMAISYRPDRIVGGVPADIFEAPYLLSIQIFGRHFCTASIISPSWALTSAQCFPDYYAVKKMTVYGGTNRVPSFGYAYKLSTVKIHKRFNVTSHRIPANDIAAIKPETEFQHFQDNMEPILVPSSDFSFAHVLGTIFGWGALKENEYPLPTYLHKANIPVLKWSDCGKLIPHQWNVFCAGYFEGGVSPCDGDIGIPLVINNTLGGIFSLSNRCGRPKNPSVYTSVRIYRDWIKKVTHV